MMKITGFLFSILFASAPAFADAEKVSFVFQESTTAQHISIGVGAPTEFLTEGRGNNESILSGAILPVEKNSDGVEAFIDITLNQPMTMNINAKGACQRPVVSTKSYGVVYERFQWGQARTFCFSNGRRIQITAIKSA